MAISFVGSSATATIPAHVAGDLIVAFARSNGTAPGVPSGWTNVASVGPLRVVWRIASAAGTTISWSGSTQCGSVVYRGPSGVGVGVSATASGTTFATAAVPALSGLSSAGTSWVMTVAEAAGQCYPPNTLTRRTSGTAPAYLMAADTAAPQTSFSSIPFALNDGNSWSAVSIELLDVLKTTSGSNDLSLLLSGAALKALGVNSGIPLDLTVQGGVVRSEGPGKTTSAALSIDLTAFASTAIANKQAGASLNLTFDLAAGVTRSSSIGGDTSLDLNTDSSDSKSVTRDGDIALNLALAGNVFRKERNLTGLMARLVGYAPNGDCIGPLPGVQSWDVTIPYGEMNGAISVKYPRIAPRFDLVSQPIEVALEVHDGEQFVEPWDCRWLIMNNSYDEIDPASVVDLSGVSMGVRLDKTVVFDGPTDGATPGERRFTSATAGRIMRTLLDEAQARGALQGIDTSTFTAETDSAGHPWSLVYSIGFSVGLPLLKVVEALLQQGMMEIRWNGRQLLLFDVETSSLDRTVAATPVVLQVGRDLSSAEKRSTIADTASVAVVRGDEGISVEVSDPTLVSPWGRWETVLDQGGIDSHDVLEEAGTATLARVGAGRSEHTHGLNFLGAEFMPLRAYQPGDWVYSITGDSSTRARYRVRQITLSFDTAGVVSGSVVLNDLLLEADVKIKKRMDGVQGGATNNSPRPRPIEGDKTTPNPPTNLAVTSSVYLDDKRPAAQVTLTWDDPTTNTDGSTLDDLQFIQIWAKPQRAGTTWRLLTTAKAGEETVTFSPLEVSATYSFRASALDYTGHASVDSNTVTVALADDVTAPPVPSVPSVTSKNGVVEVSFDGKTSTGAEMPLDFSHVEVYAASTSTVNITPANLVGTIAEGASALTLARWPYNVNIYARLVAVDVSGNKSAPGTVSAGTANPKVGTGDIGNDAVGSDQINVPALDSAGNLRVNQLDGKTINGVTINGGSFLTTSGDSRIEMGDTGDGDPVDEIRMFNGGYVSSIRNPSSRPGSIRFSIATTSGGGGGSTSTADFANDSLGHFCIHGGGGTFKFLTGGGMQVRNAADSDYGIIYASQFSVVSELRFKKNVQKFVFKDYADVLHRNGAHQWQWREAPEGGTEKAGSTEIGLIADYLPPELREGEGYSVTAVMAFLWDAVKDAHQRIAKLEGKKDG